MARTIQEIKKSMTDRFMSDNTLRAAYGITGADATWDTTFSAVSIENILLHTVAACAYSLEVLFEAYKEEVDERIAANIVPTVRWYHTQALAFQYGDNLAFDEKTQSFRYAAEDESKKIVKYCAVQDAGNTIQMLVSGRKDGLPAVIEGDEMTAFKAYMNSVKIAGVFINIQSLPADRVKISAKVYVNPMVIDSAGKRISDGSRPVEDAVNDYLAGVIYGGTFNKTKLVDAIQAVEGVTDVELLGVQAKQDGGSYAEVAGNNYTAVSGSFISEDLNTTITYVVQD